MCPQPVVPQNLFSVSLSSEQRFQTFVASFEIGLLNRVPTMWVPFGQETGWAQEQVWTLWSKMFCPFWKRNPGRPPRSPVLQSRKIRDITNTTIIINTTATLCLRFECSDSVICSAFENCFRDSESSRYAVEFPDWGINQLQNPVYTTGRKTSLTRAEFEPVRPI
jgi:hypothetical protein